MQTLHFTTIINAPKEKVWDAMLGDSTYREWTKPFGQGEEESYFVGNWEQGTEMRFLGGHEESGILSRVKEYKLHELVSLEHIGVISKGVADTESEDAKKWTPASESYAFRDVDGGTELTVDTQVADEYKDSFNDMWTKSLETLKQISER